MNEYRYPINLWSLGSSISLLDLWEDKYGLREDTTNHSLDSVSSAYSNAESQL
jgi:hypothetical protein